MVQYLTYFPDPGYPREKGGAVVHRSVQLTELGEKVAGFTEYPAEDCSLSPVVKGGFYNDEQLY
jgi:hypothetical protein